MRFRLLRPLPVSLVTLGIGLLSALVPDAGAQLPAKLLLHTVSVTGNNQEYIAVYNPNSTAVDLSNYYISDAIHSTSGTLYAYIVNPAAGIPGGRAASTTSTSASRPAP
jgi:hypothetical protein